MEPCNPVSSDDQRIPQESTAVPKSILGTTPREYLIPFSAAMLAAIEEDRKTRTRRCSLKWLRVKKGDELFCQEALVRSGHADVTYERDGVSVPVSYWWRWQRDRLPSIFCPRDACRLRLVATADARLERLQYISDVEAMEEGCASGLFHDPWVCDDGETGWCFPCLWNSINGKTKGLAWADNPEVVVLAFRRLQP